MTQSAETTWLDDLPQRVKENRATLAETLSQALGRPIEFNVESAIPWSTVTTTSDLWQTPGLIATMAVGDIAIAIAIPQTFPLPDWYQSPNKSQQSCLETLPMEWSFGLLPEDTVADAYEAWPVADLQSHLNSRLIDADTHALPLYATEGAGQLLLVFPISRKVAPGERDEPLAAPAGPSFQSASSSASSASRLDRIRKLPTQVSVRLAEKRISVGQLLAITPGSLITFEKSCEDLLDLYVNNQRYCQGEAVKTGENFGIKITSLQLEPIRTSKLIDH